MGINKHKNEGHCIRCDIKIELNPNVPYCKDCYNIWKKDEDERNEENYCHICGKEKSTTMLKPSCYSCYEKNKDQFKFKA